MPARSPDQLLNNKKKHLPFSVCCRSGGPQSESKGKQKYR